MQLIAEPDCSPDQ